MVATKILSTINKSTGATPSGKKSRSSSFDHTTTTTTTTPGVTNSAAGNITASPSGRRSLSFDHTTTPASPGANVTSPLPSSRPPTSPVRKAPSKGKPPLIPDSPVPKAGSAALNEVARDEAIKGEQSEQTYWETAKSYASDAYDRIVPESLSASQPSEDVNTAANIDRYPTTNDPIQNMDAAEANDAYNLTSLQRGLSNLLSGLYIRSYTNLADLMGSDDPLRNVEREDDGQLILPAEPPSNAMTTANAAVLNYGTGASPRRGPPIELSWLTRNPYNVVAGRHNAAARDAAPNSSLDAVRSLLTLVPVVPATSNLVASGGGGGGGGEKDVEGTNKRVRWSMLQQPKLSVEENDDQDNNGGGSSSIPLSESMLSTASSAEGSDAQLRSFPNMRPSRGGNTRQPVSDAETASRLAEGTIRALRDLALDEAVELHSALRFWTERWERPVLSWLEAGPTVWFSSEGYNHQVVGRKVSQIQAVLARRCASVGELQEHLLRAGWQKGVQQWGVLGQGGQWATVAGGDGRMDGDGSQRTLSTTNDLVGDGDEPTLSRESLSSAPASGPPRERSLRDYYSMRDDLDNEKSLRVLSPQSKRRSMYYGLAEVLVDNSRGGRIERNDPALAAWTVDALRVVRDQLYKAGNKTLILPYYENWKDEIAHFCHLREKSFRDNTAEPATTPIRFTMTESLPLWATEDADMPIYESPQGQSSLRRARYQQSDDHEESNMEEYGPSFIHANEAHSDDSMEEDVSNFIRQSEAEGITGDIVISELPLFAQEVSSLLDSMELLMENQRRRRLLKLKQPPRIKRQWYVASIVAPTVGYAALRLFKDGYIKDGIRWIGEQLGNFYIEHLSGPIKSIYGELVKGKPDITDKKARLEAITTLKNMIGSWLEETFPQMTIEEKINIADSMDISLCEKAKEEAIKRSVFEINSIVRLSMIEMQFIKKELMSALVAMDELMSSNEINAKIAAMTPAVLLLYGARSIFRFCFYALLKFGKSREETFHSFRLTILDIERLLTMRDNPPDAPPPLSGSIPSVTPHRSIRQSRKTNNRDNSGNVLDANDLGMLMLHIHECRKLLWEDRRRFSTSELRNVTEDLAELAGERGPVSVQQQLLIISRMCRTYSFLKVISTGHSFDFAFRSSSV